MAHLQSDGAKVFSLWHKEGLTGYRKRPRDPAQLAKLMIDIGSGEVEELEPTPEGQGKNASPVARSKAGGPKDGRARALKLTAEQRADIARGRIGSLGKLRSVNSGE